MKFQTAVAALLVLSLVSQAFGWCVASSGGRPSVIDLLSPQFAGATGHITVGLIAQHYLNAAATKAASTFNGAGKTLGDVATEADAFRTTPNGKWSSGLHYADMPQGSAHFSMSACPNNYCVVGAIMNFTNILKSMTPHYYQWSADYIEPSPLAFLVHFVGDVHQPLHVGYANDKGGNDVKVRFFNDDTNLHSVWDGGIIYHYNLSAPALANSLINYLDGNPSKKNTWASNTDPSSWADESYQYVRTTVYNFSAKQYSQREVVTLGQAYYTRNLPVVKDRLAAAGIRLATLLNSIYH